MYTKWSTGNARFRADDDDHDDDRYRFDDDANPDRRLYDFGACTVPQLLLGYDEALDQRVQQQQQQNRDDENRVAADDFQTFYDGQNPCLESLHYYTWITRQLSQATSPPTWDFVVLNDNTRGPARAASRAQTLDVLESTYVPWFLETGAIPVLLATYGYSTPYRDMTGLDDVPTFTSYTYNGYLEYAAVLESQLPATQRPRIAKVGWAFLLVYEENYELWTQLFHVDQTHASPLGTYLQALVVYHALLGRLPPRNVALRPDSSSMWDDARRFAPPNHRRGRFPTPAEEQYLYHVAQRICLHGTQPKGLTLYDSARTVEYEPQDSLYREDDIF